MLGELVQPDEEAGVLVREQEFFGEWVGQPVRDTGWRGRTKVQLRAMGGAAIPTADRASWARCGERGKGYDRG